MLISAPGTRLSRGGRGGLLCFSLRGLVPSSPINFVTKLGVEGVTLGQLVQEHYLNAFSELFLLQSF